MIKKLKACLFDLGSTLMEYEKFSWVDMNRMGLSSGYKFLLRKNLHLPPFDECAELFMKIYDDTKKEYDKELREMRFYDLVVEAFSGIQLPTDRKFVLEFISEYYHTISEIAKPIDGAVDLLKKLKSGGVKIVIVSNSIFPAYLHLNELEKYNIIPYVDGLIFSCEIGIKKPHPDIYMKALEIAGCYPSEAVFIGDRFEEDVIGPREVGIKSILKRKVGKEYPPEIEKYPICDNLGEIKSLIGLRD